MSGDSEEGKQERARALTRRGKEKENTRVQITLDSL
jgi:hypothetical protein